MIGDEKSLLKSSRIFHWFQVHILPSVTPQIPKKYVLHVLKLVDWIYLLVIWDQRSLNYTMSVILGLIDICLFAKFTSSLEFMNSFTLVLAGKVKEILA